MCRSWHYSCCGYTGLHAAPGKETSLCKELEDTNETAVLGVPSVINVTQVPVIPHPPLSKALCQEQLCHSNWL